MTMKKTLTLALLALSTACGGSDDETSSPAVVCDAGTTIAIAAPGAAPACIRAAPSATVTITNPRATTVEIRSNPHPTHGSCPEIDATAPIPAGGSVAVVMITVGTCRFHDHADGTPVGIIQVGSGTPTPVPEPPGGY